MTGINVSLPPPLPPFYYLLFSPAFFTLPESLKFYYGNTRLRGHETPADVSISFDSVLGEVKLIGCVTPLSYFILIYKVLLPVEGYIKLEALLCPMMYHGPWSISS